MDSARRGGVLDLEDAMAAIRLAGALLARWLQDVRDGFWNCVDYVWFCKWMP